LAEYLGVTRQAVSRWESGATLPDALNLVRLAELFGVSIDWLLRGNQSVTQEREVPDAAEKGEEGQTCAADFSVKRPEPRSERRIPHLFCGFCWLIAAGSFVVAGALGGEIWHVVLALINVMIACLHFVLYFRGSEINRALSWHSMEKEAQQYLISALLFLLASVCFFLAGAIGGNFLLAFAGLMELVAALGFFYRWHKIAD
jgi:transcriptional regulator with XRE-family HTH domain